MKKWVRLVGVILTSGFAVFSANTMAGAQCSHGGSVGFSGPQMSPSIYHERGKSAYYGRSLAGKKIKYCVMVNGEAKKISRSRLKAFNNGAILDFATSLVDCDNPSRLALAQIESKKISDVLYYLSSKYKLTLNPLSPEEMLARRAAARQPVVATTTATQGQSPTAAAAQ